MDSVSLLRKSNCWGMTRLTCRQSSSPTSVDERYLSRARTDLLSISLTYLKRLFETIIPVFISGFSIGLSLNGIKTSDNRTRIVGGYLANHELQCVVLLANYGATLSHWRPRSTDSSSSYLR